MGNVAVSLQVLLIAIVIILACSCFALVYGIVAYEIHKVRNRRREERLSKKFFQKIERYHDDFA